MKIHFVVLFRDEARLEAVVEDDDGRRRRIEYTWMVREQKDLPPEGWHEAVLRECRLQQDEDRLRAQGRVLL